MEKLKIIIDRPLGTYHPQHQSLYYPVNYGYVQDIIGGDGEEQDVYVLGVDEPLKEFTGEVYAIVHRFDDCEDKWIVVPENMTLTYAEIEAKIAFQEQYFHHILMFMNQPIRQATKQDISRISEILVFTKRIAYRDIFQDDYVSFQELQVCNVYQAYMQDLSLLHHFFVYDNGIVKGMMEVEYHNNELELKQLYVDSFFQGQHIGTQFIIFLFEIAKRINVNQIILWVIEKNQQAIAFYEKFGFVKTVEKELMKGTQYYQIKMTQKLINKNNQ